MVRGCHWPVGAWWLVTLAFGMVMSVPGMLFGQGEPVVPEPDGDGVRRVAIVLDSYAFTPGYFRVPVGVPVELRLENRSFLIPHNFIIDSPVTAMRRKVNVSAGDSVTLRFLPEAPGLFTFYCDKQLLFFPSHREKGMEGRLEVTDERH